MPGAKTLLKPVAGIGQFFRMLATQGADANKTASSNQPSQPSKALVPIERPADEVDIHRERPWWWWGKWDEHARNHVYGAPPPPAQDLSQLPYVDRFVKWGFDKFEAEKRNQSVQGWRNFLWNDQARWVKQRAEALRRFVDSVTNISEAEKAVSVEEWWEGLRRDWEVEYREALYEQFKDEWKKWQFTDFEEWLNKIWIEIKVYLGFSAGFFLGGLMLKYGLDSKAGENNIRGIRSLFEHNGIWNAVSALKDSKNVAILTGFSVAEDMPETDGPPGAAAIAYAHYLAGAKVTLIADKANMPILKACVAELDPGLAQHVQYKTLNLTHDFVGQLDAATVLDEIQPDAVIAIELPGRNHESDMLNMRGLSVRPFNAALYKLLEEANERGIPTAGIGDGGNEAGVLSAEDLQGATGKKVPLAMNGQEMKSVVPSKYPMTAWNSNFGGYAYAALMMKMHGQEDRFIKGHQAESLNMAALDAGAVDGVTRKGKAGAPSSTDPRFVTGTDGYEAARHAADLEELNATLTDADLYKRNLMKAEGSQPSPFTAFQFVDKWNAFIVTPRRWILKRLTKEVVDAAHVHANEVTPGEDKRPTLKVGLCDSSQGLLVGAKNKLIDGLKEKFWQFNLKFFGIGDHRKAPYGQYTPEELRKLDNDMLHVAQQAGCDAALMVCNTASTVLDSPEAMEGIHIPVVNLVLETAKGIAAAGGEHPTIVSTQATADSESYKESVAQASGGGIAIRPEDRIGAPTWAPAINAAMHLDPAQKAHVQALVDEVIEKVPQDSTSIWMCCTHYPELIPFIQNTLNAHGRSHVKVVDPMEYLLRGAVDAIERLPKVLRARKEGLPPGPGHHDPNFTLLSSGTADQVVESAIDLTHTKIPPANMQFVTDLTFGPQTDPRLEHLRNVNFEGTQYDSASRFQPPTPTHVLDPLASPLEVPHPQDEAGIQAEITYGEFGGGAGESGWLAKAGIPDTWNPWNMPAAMAGILEDIEAGMSLEEVCKVHRVSRAALDQMLATGELERGRGLRDAALARRAQADEWAAEVERSSAANHDRARREQAAARIRVARILLAGRADAVPVAGPGASLQQLEAECQALEALVDEQDAATARRIAPVTDASA